MANVYEPEPESDEDCEVYFLKPVNEYNIVDKIKEANKELFGQNQSNEEQRKEEVENEETLAASINRKVKFATNLEQYEPQAGITNKELEEKLGKINPDEDNLNEEDIQKLNEPKLEVITEEDTNNEIVNSDKTEIPLNDREPETEMNCNVTKKDSSETFAQEVSLEKLELVQEDIILEEICEEILIMDMENDKSIELRESHNSESPGTIQRRMLKQITFDYDEESDNKSLTNLLISDNENDDEDDDQDAVEEYNCNESINEETDTEEKLFLNNNEYYDDDEEDDKLSIIVASYLPDDLACDKTSLTSEKSSPHTYRKAGRKLPFNKRFSFRRKNKSSNAIASSCSTNSNTRRFMPPPEVTDLKLHYKTCCEFKNAQQKLPKYTGYLSEYGLSREQLFERERKLQQKQHGFVQETLKSSENETRKIHDNEKAFTKWLKNKMRFPINKTRNMFDVKRPFGLRKCTSVGGNSLINDESNKILNTTKYRSISAKIKKK